MMLNKRNGYIFGAVLSVIGVIGALNLLIHGDHVLGTSNYVPWGSLIAAYVYFVGASAGLSLVSSLGHVFKIERFEVIGKRALVAGIATLLMGFVVIALELGKPFNMIYIIFSPGITSGIFWMGALYGTLLVLLFAEFYFVIKNKHKTASTIGLFVIIADIAAHSNLGSVFGNAIARPYWHGPFIPVYLILLAILLGLAVLSLMFYIIDRTKATKDHLYYQNEHIVTTLGKLMAVFIAFTFLFSFWNIMTNVYANNTAQQAAVLSLLTGPLAFNFWFYEILLMMVLPFVILVSKNGFKPKKVFWAAILTIIGNLFVRIDLVLAGQIVPMKIFDNVIVEQYRHATVSLTEWAIILGAIGGSILIYLLGEKYFDLNMGALHHVEEKKTDSQIQVQKA